MASRSNGNTPSIVPPAREAIRFFAAASEAREGNNDSTSTANGTLLGTLRGWDFAAAEDLQSHWNKSYPYQLVVMDASKGYAIQNDSRFTLPIPPQSLNIQTPFAIATHVTVGGVLEEHNGAPLRTISLQGTTGVLPLRGTVDRGFDLTSGPAAVMAGTINAGITGLQVAATANNLSPGLGIGQDVNTIPDSAFDSAEYGRGTGFYQFLLLKRFLESYVSMKKSGDQNLRLGLAVWKENEIWVVTPMTFDVSRNASSPLEYNYTLAFKAWKRIVPGTTAAPYEVNPGTRNPNTWAQVVNGLISARRALETYRDAMNGLRDDLQNLLFEPLRESLLFAKDAGGIAMNLADLPADIVRDTRESILEAAAINHSLVSLESLGSAFGNSASSAFSAAFSADGVESEKQDTGSGWSGRRDRTRALLSTEIGTHPAEKTIGNPSKYFEVFSGIRPGDLNLRPEIRQRIEAERNRLRVLRREDFETRRDQVAAVAADIEAALGLGDPNYSEVFGTPAPVRVREPTDDDWEALSALQDAVQALDQLAVSRATNRDRLNSLDYIAGLARASGIAFQVPASKFLVPFPYGFTLEQLAQQYLGSADRWMEIAALNGLRAPYVDEVGFELPLLVPGTADKILVSDATNLYVNQTIWLSSAVVRRESRRILGIRKLSPTQVELRLDGDPDLDKFNPVAGAGLQAFLPDTVNSLQSIYIPDSKPSDVPDLELKPIPGVNDLDPLVRSGGVDLLLTADGDLAITPDGQTRLAVGLTNIIQRIKLVMATRKGSLLWHPDYGLGLRHGISNAEIKAKDIMTGLKTFFASDPTFTGLDSVGVQMVGNFLRVRMAVGLAATGQLLPVQVDVR